MQLLPRRIQVALLVEAATKIHFPMAGS